MPLREFVMLPQLHEDKPEPVSKPAEPPQPAVQTAPPKEEPVMEQTSLEMPPEIPWRMVGELYNTYIIVEQGEDAFLIDKHAAHERILFEKLKANPESISAQSLLQPIPVRLNPAAAGELLHLYRSGHRQAERKPDRLPENQERVWHFQYGGSHCAVRQL